MRKIIKELAGWLVYIVIVVIIAWGFVTFVAQRTQVSGSSMETTLSDGDQLIVDKISYQFREPERFEIIVFPYQYEAGTYYIKRIIGLPGENVRIDEDGFIYINGEKLQIMAVFFLVPVLVKPPDHVGKGGDCFLGIEVDAPQHHPDILLDEFFAPGKAPAKDLHLTGIRMHQAQNGLDGSALAGAVAANEAHHRPLGHGKGHILQCKSRVRLAQTPDLHDVHSSSTSASVSSNTRRIMGLSLSVVCRAMPFFRSASSTS